MKNIELGKIVNIHGVHGEVKINPYADGPEFFKNFDRVFINSVTYKVKNVKVAKGCAVLKLEGVDTVDDAQKLREKVVTVPESDLPPLPEGVFYIKDLVGMEVYADGDFLGTLTEVINAPANDVYVVKNAMGKEFLIPSVPIFVKNRDIAKKRMDITHIRGITYDED